MPKRQTLDSQQKSKRATNFFTFPDPVNEVAARSVALGVVIMVVLIITTHNRLLFIPLCCGFIARLAAGPKISILGQIATKLVAPNLPNHEKLVAGKPKRFAQGIGVVFSIAAAIAALATHSVLPSQIILALLGIAAALEAFFSYCLGCKAFALLFRFGIVTYNDCPSCVVQYAK
ncbi:DUF4395 domain-containing protein [Acidithrix sp. C25]|uniref:DUF4395 domain-containing protein n=1 Tax=Acidithrix sp. C25 TaxID=1671482 RepID=UPI00191B9509|nr:DUF4395 domain-containing protein [Acidithrix sp. C25]CAG4934749.1 unnamed protein product [Acidithrix sp. C25]